MLVAGLSMFLASHEAPHEDAAEDDDERRGGVGQAGGGGLLSGGSPNRPGAHTGVEPNPMLCWRDKLCMPTNRVLRAEKAVIVTKVHARAAIVTGGVVMDLHRRQIPAVVANRLAGSRSRSARPAFTSETNPADAQFAWEYYDKSGGFHVWKGTPTAFRVKFCPSATEATQCIRMSTLLWCRGLVRATYVYIDEAWPRVTSAEEQSRTGTRALSVIAHELQKRTSAWDLYQSALLALLVTIICVERDDAPYAEATAPLSKKLAWVPLAEERASTQPAQPKGRPPAPMVQLVNEYDALRLVLAVPYSAEIRRFVHQLPQWVTLRVKRIGQALILVFLMHFAAFILLSGNLLRRLHLQKEEVAPENYSTHPRSPTPSYSDASKASGQSSGVKNQHSRAMSQLAWRSAAFVDSLIS
ncbi:hypothetical protein BKA62DRAFT_760014 [Auriculariales sp. MPI-PUGE-AT-0066]|nr:hypothetical protein BKA62DRAFT_760014 [Auriculariales sp. MPI-PUGE-AT-0066]